MQKLINCSGTYISVDSLRSVDDAITPNVGTGFRGFFYWILWSQAKRLLYDRIPIRTVEWNCGILVKRDLQRLVDWDHICDAFHLSTTNTSPVPTETPSTSDTISPRAFCALLRLSSVSDYSCEVVCGAAERMFKKDSKSWSSETLPVQNILLAVCIFLHAVSLTEQPLAWWRGFRLLDRLVNSDILWIPYRPRVDKQSHCSSEIYLVDWSKFRGSLDFLSLFADLIRVQTLSNDKVTSNVAMRFLCTTLSTILTRTLNRIGSIDDTRYRSVVQIQSRGLCVTYKIN
ncbi:hypothetical protein FGIG_11021 [Fasciola gigantica]|uniref:Uncharacterized protein n=1 Tax=Fasciola gigantica TaxID=46835 RepID=A0A504YZ70_FASGI|nr:hypothetical protein FGIG_11021 [Fasciola gigantica]